MLASFSFYFSISQVSIACFSASEFAFFMRMLTLDGRAMAEERKKIIAIIPEIMAIIL